MPTLNWCILLWHCTYFVPAQRQFHCFWKSVISSTHHMHPYFVDLNGNILCNQVRHIEEHVKHVEELNDSLLTSKILCLNSLSTGRCRYDIHLVHIIRLVNICSANGLLPEMLTSIVIWCHHATMPHLLYIYICVCVYNHMFTWPLVYFCFLQALGLRGWGQWGIQWCAIWWWTGSRWCAIWWWASSRWCAIWWCIPTRGMLYGLWNIIHSAILGSPFIVCVAEDWWWIVCLSLC